jgi:hypothetical protein
VESPIKRTVTINNEKLPIRAQQQQSHYIWEDLYYRAAALNSEKLALNKATETAELLERSQ